MTATCCNCPYGRQTAGREGREYKCLADAPKVLPLPDGLQIDTVRPSVDSGEVCGRHPWHPGRVHELAALAMAAQIANSECVGVSAGWDIEAVTTNAYKQARAMLYAAEKEGGK